MDLIEKGLAEGLIKFNDGRAVITYIHQDKKRKFTNPEEHVQAKTFLQLILMYNYPVECIQQFVNVKMGSTSKEADIIVYNSDDLTDPYIIVECKEPEVSEAEFEQAIGQGFSYGYATPRKLKFIWVTSGLKNNYYEFNKDRDERKNIPDIPKYGITKLEKYRYVKGGKNQNEVDDDGTRYEAQQFFELETVAEDELTRRFKQAHQALWGGGNSIHRKHLMSWTNSFSAKYGMKNMPLISRKKNLFREQKGSPICSKFTTRKPRRKRFKHYLIALNLSTT